MYLALDLSTATGFAKYDPSSGITSGEYEVYGKDLGGYALDFARWIAPTLQGVTDVFIEDIFLGKNTGTETVIKLAGLRWEVAKACKHRGIKCHQPVVAGEWRKLVLGTGAAPKSVTGASKRRAWLKKAAIDYCRSRGWNPKTDNEAEALCILEFMRAKLDRSYGAASTPLFMGI